MFRLPYKYVLEYRTREKLGGISILGFNTKWTAECRSLFAACGTPDRAMFLYKVESREGEGSV
jgi:hypothetical protein